MNLWKLGTGPGKQTKSRFLLGTNRLKSWILTYSQAFYSTFRHRRLLELARLGGEDLPFARFREMLEEIQAEYPFREPSS